MANIVKGSNKRLYFESLFHFHWLNFCYQVWFRPQRITDTELHDSPVPFPRRIPGNQTLRHWEEHILNKCQHFKNQKGQNQRTVQRHREFGVRIRYLVKSVLHPWSIIGDNLEFFGNPRCLQYMWPHPAWATSLPWVARGNFLLVRVAACLASHTEFLWETHGASGWKSAIVHHDW